MESIALTLLGALAAGCMVIQHRSHARGVARARARCFAPEVVALVDGVAETRGLQYPVLHGNWHARRMRAELLPDTLGFRTVPTLWLVVQVAGPPDVSDLDTGGRATVWARGTGQEFFVPRHPGYRRIRSDRLQPQLTVAGPDDEAGRQRAEAVAARLAPLFDDGRVKLVDVTPSSLRIVVRAHQADPATYRVTRTADFSDATVGEATWGVGGRCLGRARLSGRRGPEAVVSRRSTPLSAWEVLAVAMVLPGMGQVLNGQPRRGLLMDFYMVLLAVLTYSLADPGRSLVGKLAGGLFVYAMSLMDAYRTAALRHRLSTEAVPEH